MCTELRNQSATPESRHRGATLIEIVIFIVIISLAVTGILLVMNRVTGSSADAVVNKQALAIAESLLEEIELQGVSGVVPNPGTMANANRSGFDNVFNYNGYYTNGGILDFSTNTGVGLTAYNVTPAVSVTNVTLSGAPAVQIDVHVTGPGGTTIDLTGYRAGN
jgi:MSHA pilin protein MshD